MNIKCLILFMISAVISQNSFAGKLLLQRESPDRVDLIYQGEIESGDSEQLSNFIREKPYLFMWARRIYLNSPGGSVDEAVKIGRILEHTGLEAFVREGDTCASACFLLLIATPHRSMDVDANVLVHRPYVLGEKEADLLEYHRNMSRQKTAIGEMRDYLSERAIASSLIDAMMMNGVESSYKLDLFDFAKEVGFYSPEFQILLYQRCHVDSSGYNIANLPIEERKRFHVCRHEESLWLNFSIAYAIMGPEKIADPSFPRNAIEAWDLAEREWAKN